MSVSVRALEQESVMQVTKRVVGNDGRSYSYWRLRILYASILGYAAFYLVRQNFAMALPAISAEFNYTKAELGWVISAFSLVYGLGKFFNGYLSDRSNARYFITIGLVGTAVISLFMGTTSWLWAFAGLWAVNGWFQSMGWPPCARLLTHWFSSNELGTKWSIWSSSHQIGSAAISVLAGFLIVNYGWRYAFFVPGLLALAAALFVMNRVRDNPKVLGFPPVEEYKNDVKSDCDEKPKISLSEVYELVIKNKYVWFVSIANLFLYIPRMGVMNWAPIFLKEFKGVDLIVAGGQVAIFDIAGLLGGLGAGWVSDKFFAGRRGPVGTVYLILLSGAILALISVPAGFPLLDTICLFFAGFLVSGPQVLVGVSLADFTSKRAVGVATGFAGVMGHGIGSVISGGVLGNIIDTWGWTGGFNLLIASSLAGAFFFALTWRKKRKEAKTS